MTSRTPDAELHLRAGDILDFEATPKSERQLVFIVKVTQNKKNPIFWDADGVDLATLQPFGAQYHDLPLALQRWRATLWRDGENLYRPGFDADEV